MVYFVCATAYEYMFISKSAWQQPMKSKYKIQGKSQRGDSHFVLLVDSVNIL